MLKNSTVFSSYRENSLFIVLPVPIRLIDNKILLESQSHHGLDMYAQYFDHITVSQPVLPELFVPERSWHWIPAISLKNIDKVEFKPLPWGYKAVDHLRYLQKVSRLLDDNIISNQYLKFCMGGLFGDWGSVACSRAQKLKRPYAVWADWVEHLVLKKTAKDSTKDLFKSLLTAYPMSLLEKKIVKRAAVGLFNGYEVWKYYQQFNPNSHQMYDIHTNTSHQIGVEALGLKLKEIQSGAPLKICYAGRMDSMKAPLEWLEILYGLKQLGVKFKAIWMGSGDQAKQMDEKAREYQLENELQLTGFMSDHDKVLKIIQQSHIFLFCHIAPESPRCLMESLLSGTPIIGYRSDYSNNLIEQEGGGSLVNMHDIHNLTQLLVSLNEDRDQLTYLVQQAAENGKRFSDTDSFDRRVELIKKYT